MELRDYLSVLWRRRWIVLLTIIFAVIAALLVVIQLPVTYTATSTVRVLTTKSGGADYVEYDIAYAERLTGTYVEIAKSEPVANELLKYVDRLPQIDVQIVPDTELIKISVTDPDPGLAQFSANKLAEIIIEESRQVYMNDVSPINIYMVEPAVLPTNPSSTNPILIIGLAFVVGLFGGIGLAFLLENLDTRLYTAHQIENITQLPIIGDIPDYRVRSHVSLFQDSLTHIEAFRRLRTNIFSSTARGSIKSMLVTSAIKQDGRTAVVANLALSLAQGHRRVAVVDANLRNPSLHEIFGVGNEVGLTDVLQKTYPLSGALQKTSFRNITILTSGPIPENPAELVDTEEMNQVIIELSDNFDVVLVDSPASVSVTDPAILATKVDGVLLVVRQGWVRREALAATLTHLKNVQANLIGVVVNRTDLGVGKRYKVKISNSVVKQPNEEEVAV